MHPRNIYRTPPDFSKLAIKYPEFLKISNIDLNGTVRINFKDANALRVLTKCLLHSDFDLDVDIPDDRLVPTVPLRLNYLLWLEDLLNAAGRSENITGIDIGTGACCIYPLLAAKKFNWKMHATEVDEKSLNLAIKNVKQNNLDNLISVKQVSEKDKLLFDCFTANGGSIECADFCMCNPPFYSSVDELDCGRSSSRAPPRNARTGSVNEIVTPGGEEAFVEKLINDSLKLLDNVRIYTTMLGHKSSLKPLLDILQGYGITQYTHTVFRQGKTMRWGLAWSFMSSSNLCSQAVPQKQKINKPMSFAIPPIDGLEHSVKEVTVKILQILKNIEIQTKVVQQSEVITTMEIKSAKNTWSNQRKKRRELQNQLSHAPIVNGDGNKRKIDQSDCKESAKRIKIDTDDSDLKICDKINNNKSGDCSSIDDTPYLTAGISIRKDAEYILFEIGFLKGEAGKDGVHQIVQYVKNNWR